MTFSQIIIAEFNAVFSNKAIILTVFGGVLFYSFLYPLPYSNQIPRDLQVVVVNLDDSQLSRRLERMIDATPQVELVRRAYSIEEAQKIFIEEDMAGIVVIPEHFHRDLLLGKRPTLSFAGDASYFLIYGTVIEGMAGAGNQLAAGIKVNRMVMSGQSPALAREQYRPIRLNLRMVFNETEGYVNYVIPAVFILILHHTLIMAAAILGSSQNEAQAAGVNGYWQQAAPIKLLVARTAVFIIIYWLLSLYYFGFSFDFYHIPRQASISGMTLVMVPFLLSAAFFGICLGLILPRRELSTPVLLFSSMPLIFGCGFIWPVESIPAPITAVFQLVPAIPAIHMFLKINQLGADFVELLPLWKQLWICTAVYGSLSWCILQLKRKQYHLLSARQQSDP
ncbi:MAG: ABC transporter [Proteobacteria bacterium]|nr:MAG: ABC transporter [Pseudomonadota bacterium]